MEFEEIYKKSRSLREMAQVTQQDLKDMDPADAMTNRQAYIHGNKDLVRDIEDKWFKEHPEALEKYPNRSPHKAWIDATHSSIYKGKKKSDRTSMVVAARFVDTYEGLPNRIGIVELSPNDEEYYVEISSKPSWGEGSKTVKVPGILVIEIKGCLVAAPEEFYKVTSERGFRYRQLGVTEEHSLGWAGWLVTSYALNAASLVEDFSYSSKLLKSRGEEKSVSFQSFVQIEYHYDGMEKYMEYDGGDGNMLSCIRDADLRRKLSSAIRDKFLSKFNPNDLIDFTSDLMEEDNTKRPTKIEKPEGIKNIDVTLNDDKYLDITVTTTGETTGLGRWLESASFYYYYEYFHEGIDLGVRGKEVIGTELADDEYFTHEEDVKYILKPYFRVM